MGGRHHALGEGDRPLAFQPLRGIDRADREAIAEGLSESDSGKAVIDVASRLLKRPFRVLEQHLSSHDYLVGDRFTVADLNAAEIVRYAQGHKPLFDAHPALKAWLDRCQARTAFKTMWDTRAAEAA